MRTQTPQKAELFACAPMKILLGVFAVFLYAFLLTLSTLHHTAAASLTTINFQARLESNTGAIAPDGSYNIDFKLYDHVTNGAQAQGTCSSDCLWEETYYDSNGVTAGNDNRLTVVNGYVTVNLGSLNAFPGTINWDQDLYLTMNIGGTTQTATPTYDGEMSPRLKLTAVPYAFKAGQLSKLTGANTSTLNFASQTGARSILLPDESGTICIQGSANCGFLTPAVANGSYVQLQGGAPPGTAQTGNFNISGTGIAGILQGTTSVQTPLLDTASPATLNIGTTNATAINLNQNTTLAAGKTLTVQGTALFKNNANSTTSFQVQPAASTIPVLNVDTTNSRIGVGTATPQAALHVSLDGATPNAGLLFSTLGLLVTNSTSQTNIEILTASGNAAAKSAVAGVRSRGTVDIPTKVLQGDGIFSFQASGYDGGNRQNSASIDFTVDGATSTGTVPMNIGFATGTSTATRATVLTLSSIGAALFQNRTDSATALQVQNALGTSVLFDVDTTNSRVGVGTNAPGYRFDVQGGDINTSGIYRVAGTAGLTTTCSGGDFLQNAVIQGGIVTAGTCIAGSAGAITSLTLAGTSGVNQTVTNGATIVIAAGTNITTTGGATDTVTVATVNNPSFSGVITSTVATGTAPFTVASTTNVTNLSADTLDGIDSTGFAAATGSANYIQNQNAAAQAASNFWISGTGTVNLLNSVTGFQFNGAVGATTTCTGGNVLQNAVIQGGIVTGGTCAAGGGAGSYVTLQAGSPPGTPDTGNFNISGTGIAAILQAGTFDTASATTLNIGTTNATAISIGKTTSNTLTTINGTALVKPTTGNDSATAFRVQDASGTNVLNVDTTAKRVTVGSIGTPVSQLYVGGLIPTAATSSTSFASGRTGHALVAAGNYIYTANFVSGNNSIEVYDVTKPSAPALVNGPSGMSLTFGVTDLAVSGHYLYAVGGSGANGFHVIDISNPSSLVDLVQINVDPIYTLSAVSVQGRYAYILASSGSIYIYDISNPATPTLAGSITSLGITTAKSFSLSVVGSYAYVSAYSPGRLYIVNISNPASPTLMNAGGFALASNANQVVVQGRYAYVANQNVQKLQIIDISNPTTPVAVSTLSGTISGASISVAVAGQRAYVLDDTNKLYVIDIADPASPQVLGSVSTTTAASEVIVAGRFAYVSAASLQLFDLGGSNIQQLQAGSASLGSLQLSGSATIYGSTSVQGGLQVGQSLAVTGNFGANGMVNLRNASNSATAFLIQKADGSALFTADTSSMQIVVGTTSNGVVLSANGIQLKGTARNSKIVLLTAEYPGAVLDAGTGVNNSGTMTSGFDTTNRVNYYRWTTTQVSAQTYDVVIQVPIPSDFDQWNTSGTPLTISTWSTNITNATGQMQVLDTANSTICTFAGNNITPALTSTWTNKTTCTLSTGTYTAGGYITITARMSSVSSANFQIGNITLNYLSKY